jgi:hypothetical protein
LSTSLLLLRLPNRCSRGENRGHEHAYGCADGELRGLALQRDSCRC